MIGVGGDEGGTVFWGKGRRVGGRGVLVLFWWSSVQEKLVESHVDLYSSLGWNSLVCLADLLCACYQERASALSDVLLSELLQELRIRPRPVVFAALAGCPKACASKSYQIVQGKGNTSLSPDEILLLRRCFSGHVYVSGPLDFSSDLGSRFAMHPFIREMPTRVKFVSWFARGIGSALRSFDCHRPVHWDTLYYAIDLDAPYLIFSSNCASKISWKFTQRLKDLGGDVNLITISAMKGEDEHCPPQYKTGMATFFEKVLALYPQRVQHIGETMHDEISEMICDLQEAAVNSNRSLRSVAAGPGDHFFVSPTAEGENSAVAVRNPLSISAHSVLGQVLFDASVPRNVEGWDIRFSSSLNGQPVASALRRRMKGVTRSRL